MTKDNYKEPLQPFTIIIMPWHPRNKYSWDFWFAWQGQTLHVFYLQASKFACAYNADKRHNIASVGHAVLTDFGWKEINPDQPAFASRDGNFWDNLSIWTGSIIEKDNLYYFFYTARCKQDKWITTAYERRLPQNIGVAVSEDLNTWTRTPQSLDSPVIPIAGTNSDFLDGINWRDPYVIKDDTDGKFYAFICAHPNNTSADAGGIVAYATSTDLENWQEEPYRILYTSDEFLFLEVPQVFWRQMNDQKWRFYLLFSPRWSSFFNKNIPIGITYYVRSQPIKDRTEVSYNSIPWESEPANILAVGSHGGKLIKPESVANPVFFGFQYEDEAGHFVGGLTDAQRVTFALDGTIHLSEPQLLPTPVTGF